MRGGGDIVFADENVTVTSGGKTLTADVDDDKYYIEGDNAGNIVISGGSTDKITLVLNNATITTAVEVTEGYDDSNNPIDIYTYTVPINASTFPGDLIIEVVGENTITTTAQGGILTKGNLTITGEGTLDIDVDSTATNAHNVDGIYSESNLVIEQATIDVQLQSAFEKGVSSSTGLTCAAFRSGGTMTIEKNANVTMDVEATGGTSWASDAVGMSSQGELTIDNATVAIVVAGIENTDVETLGSATGIYSSAAGISIDDAKVTIEAAVQGGGEASGICSVGDDNPGDITIKDATVEINVSTKSGDTTSGAYGIIAGVSGQVIISDGAKVTIDMKNDGYFAIGIDAIGIDAIGIDAIGIDAKESVTIDDATSVTIDDATVVITATGVSADEGGTIYPIAGIRAIGKAGNIAPVSIVNNADVTITVYDTGDLGAYGIYTSDFANTGGYVSVKDATLRITATSTDGDAVGVYVRKQVEATTGDNLDKDGVDIGSDATVIIKATTDGTGEEAVGILVDSDTGTTDEIEIDYTAKISIAATAKNGTASAIQDKDNEVAIQNANGDTIATITSDMTSFSRGFSSSTTYFTINHEVEGEGTISPRSGDIYMVVKNTDQTFTFTPKSGYEVEEVFVDGDSVGNDTTYTFESVTEDHDLLVVFVKEGTSSADDEDEEDVEDTEEDADEDEGEAVSESWKNPYIDVNGLDWFYDAVEFAVENGLFSGTSANTFSPNEPMTRAMIWMVLANAVDVDLQTDGIWYEQAQIWAVENGISDGTDPDGYVTREQFVAILYRFAVAMGDANDEWADLSGYTDLAEVEDYAVMAMQWAVANGIITGETAETLNPKGNTTRAAAARMLQNFME